MAVNYVVIVGGIGGNYLVGPQFFGAKQVEYWLNPVKTAVDGIGALKLDTDGKTPDPTWGVALTPGSLLTGYYGAMVKYLYGKGYAPKMFVQDWRLKIDQVILQLDALITSLVPLGTVWIVCHSNGGLVVRQWLTSITPQDPKRRVAKVIGLGVPHFGSWEAVRLLLGQNSTLQQLTLITLVGNKGPFAGITRGDDPIQVAGSWPAVYEMFPSPAAPGLRPDELAVLYDARSYTSVPSISPAWLQHARNFWASLLPVPAWQPWLDVVGVVQPTPTHYAALEIGKYPAAGGWVIDPNGGDGTVPTDWQKSGSGAVLAMGVPHGALTYDDGVLANVVAAMPMQ